MIKLEGTTLVRVKILYYHDMLPYPLPIHLYPGACINIKYDLYVQLSVYIPNIGLNRHCLTYLYGFLMEADILKRITHCDSYAI